MSFKVFTIKAQTTKFSLSSHMLFQHAGSKNSYKRKRLVELQQISLFYAIFFALFVIGIIVFFCS